MYEIARNSTVRMIVDVVASLPDVDYFDWDANENKDLPDVDLAGLIGFACGVEGKFHDITAGVAIVTQGDTGIYRLTTLVDVFYRKLMAEKRFQLFNPDGSPCGVATCFDGTAVAPVARLESRAAQTISFSARLVFGAH